MSMTMRKIAFLLLLCCLSVPAIAQQFGNVNSPALVTLAAAGAGTTDSAVQTNYYGKGAIVGINISAKSGTIAVTVAIQGEDLTSGQFYTICQTASLTSAAFSILTAYPGIHETANVSCSAPLPLLWRVEVVSGTGSTPSVTMTVGASVIE
jgi:hypothetical protein